MIDKAATDSIIDLSSGLNCLQSEVKLWNRKR